MNIQATELLGKFGDSSYNMNDSKWKPSKYFSSSLLDSHL